MAGSSDSSRLLHSPGSASYGSIANHDGAYNDDSHRTSNKYSCHGCPNSPENNDVTTIDLEMNPSSTLFGKHSPAPTWWLSPSPPSQQTTPNISNITAQMTTILTALIPGLSWLRSYRTNSILPDLMGALTVASLYIPLAFSFASVASVPPASSLYAFVFHPPIYALLGTCPLMVIGPEATGSLLVGAAIHALTAQSDDATENALIAGAATALAGLILLAMGFLRLGFLDNVLSRPLMKGFICGVGVVLVVKQAVPGLGLQVVVEAAFLETGESGGGGQESALGTLITLLGSFGQVDLLAAAFSGCTLGFVLVCAHIKKRCAKQYPAIVYLPDRFIAIVLSAFVVWLLRLDESSNLEIVGAVGSSSPGLPTFNAGLFTDLTRLKAVSNTALMIALLGYFESSVTGKSMHRPSALSPSSATSGSSLSCSNNNNTTQAAARSVESRSQTQQQQQQQQPSADRELIALGTANLIGGHFSTLPAFGGFGRSKLNLQAGSQTPMSGILLALISLLSILYITPCLYYVPRATLAAMSCAVGIAMVEECVHDLMFFIKMGWMAWREVMLMAVVAGVIFGMGMEEGVVVGMGLTLVVLVKGASGVRVHVDENDEGGRGWTMGVVVEDYKGKSPLGSGSSSSSSTPRVEKVDCLGVSRRRGGHGGWGRRRTVTLAVRDSLTFVNAGALIARIDQAVQSSSHEVDALVLDISDISAIDPCSAQLIMEALQRHVTAGARVVVCEPESQSVLRVFKRAALYDTLGGDVRVVADMIEASELLEERGRPGLL